MIAYDLHLSETEAVVYQVSGNFTNDNQIINIYLGLNILRDSLSDTRSNDLDNTQVYVSTILIDAASDR